ncbi:MAG: hypothetical protein ACMG6E_04445 [Candidatus Roizmanbacteria bacterium]
MAPIDNSLTHDQLKDFINSAPAHKYSNEPILGPLSSDIPNNEELASRTKAREEIMNELNKFIASLPAEVVEDKRV